MGTLRVEQALRHLKGAFLEMPGTPLTIGEAAQLTGLAPDTCGVMLSALADVRFVTRCDGGGFERPVPEGSFTDE